MSTRWYVLATRSGTLEAYSIGEFEDFEAANDRAEELFSNDAIWILDTKSMEKLQISINTLGI